MELEKEIGKSFFKLKLPNEEIFLPRKHTTTINDIYDYVSKNTKDDLILYYEKIPVPNNKISLTYIGYDPCNELYMACDEIIECSFINYQYNYTFKKEFHTYQTIFDIKASFAYEFHTVAQNIVIRIGSEVLFDDRIIEKETSYEVDVIEGFSLFYVFFSKFFFICLPTNSSFKDLKIAISGYHNILYTSIKYGSNLDKVLYNVPDSDEQKIDNYTSKVKVFDFTFGSQQDPKQLKICIESKSNDPLYIYDGLFSYLSNKADKNEETESIRCFLESKTHIPRNKLTRFQDNAHNDGCWFYSLSGNIIHVKVKGSLMELPYLTTIKELRYKYSSVKDKYVGIVINNHFVFEDSDFLAKYIGSVNSKETPLQIKIIMPDQGCRLCEIQSGKLPNEAKIHSIFIPTFLSFNSIATNYYDKKANSMEFYSGFYIPNCASNSPLDNNSKLNSINSTQFHAIVTQKLNIRYHFVDDKKVYTITMNNENNPQIKDLIYEIAKNQNKPYTIYDVYIGTKRVYFWEYIIEFIDQEFVIKTYKYQDGVTQTEKFIKVYSTQDNGFLNLKNVKYDITADEILKTFVKNDSSEHSLYMNFYKLSPNDKPILLCQLYDFLILNENIPMQNFLITNNNGIDINEKVLFGKNPYMSSFIVNVFNLIYANPEFVLKIPDSCKLDSKEYILPSSFDAGSFPKGSIISVDYKVKKANKFVFHYGKKKEAIIISNPEKSVNDLKQEILVKMKIFSISLKSINLEFHGIQLDPRKIFKSYKITKDSVIDITHKETLSNIEIRLFNESKICKYKFELENKENVADIIEHLKLKYKINDPDYQLDIYSKPDKNSKLKIDTPLQNNEILYASFEKIKIKLLKPDGARIEFDDIRKPTKEFFDKEILPKLPEEVSSKSPNYLALFIREKIGHYVAIDTAKSFREIGDRQFFLLKRIFSASFYFLNNEIKLNNELNISEFDTVRSVIDNYLSNIVLARSSSIKLRVNSIEINDKIAISEILAEGKKIEIILNDKEGPTSSESTVKRKKVKLSAFKPKVTSCDNNEENKKTKGTNENERSTEQHHKKEEKQEQDENKEEDKEEKQEQDENKEEGKNENESNTEQHHKKEEENKGEKQEQDENKEEEKNENESNTEQHHKKEEENKEEKQEQDENKEEKKNVNNEDNDIFIEEEEIDDDDGESLAKTKDEKVDNKNVEEEEIAEDCENLAKTKDEKVDNKNEEEEEEEEEDLTDDRTYTFSIKGKKPFPITLKKDATIKDAMEKIALQEHVAIDDVSIIFAGKKLRRKSVIAKMKFRKDEIINVLIIEPMETLLKTAKALKIIPSDLNDDDDDEYEYVYEEEEEEDK